MTGERQDEAAVRARLCAILGPAFELFPETLVRHALFRGRRLRVDLLAIPRDLAFSDIALAFETKGEREWDIPSWAQALKQASDYVLATVEPDLPAHVGKRVMATFVFPAPPWASGDKAGDASKASFLSGMAHMSGYHRVGMVSSAIYGRRRLNRLTLGFNEVWVESRGWRANARDMLSGKRQIGSQRFPILDELARLA